MKIKTGLFFGMMFLVGILYFGCKKGPLTEEDYPFYADIEDEKVIFELDQVPAVVYWSHRKFVFICYSKYADEYYDVYFKDPQSAKSLYKEIIDDIIDHQIGVSQKDFKKYRVAVKSKIYVSASVTNNLRRQKIPNELDYDFAANSTMNKAYLKKITPRE